LAYLTGGVSKTTVFRNAAGELFSSVSNGDLWNLLVKEHSMNNKDIATFISAAGVKEKKPPRKGSEVSEL